MRPIIHGWKDRIGVAEYVKEDWIPPYSVRENGRAKRVILRILPEAGLVLTVPCGFDRNLLPGILEQHRRWIERHMGEVGDRPPVDPASRMPDTIFLEANAETWTVRYQNDPGSDLLMNWRVNPDRIIDLTGDLSRVSDCCRLLRAWLKDQGRRLLVPWVEEWSDATGLRVRRVQLRVQKSRWGSYSSRGTLSLNASLLLLPKNLVDYVLVHELCHIDHPGHSSSFWKQVERWQPDYRRLDTEIKEVVRKLPSWVRS